MFYFKLLCISNWSVNSLTLSKNWGEKREAQSQTSGHCVMLQIFLFNSNTTFDLMLIQNVKNDVGFIGHYLCFTASLQTSLYGKHYSLIWAVDAYGSFFFFWQILCHPWQADLWSSSQDGFFFFSCFYLPFSDILCLWSMQNLLWCYRFEAERWCGLTHCVNTVKTGGGIKDRQVRGVWNDPQEKKKKRNENHVQII